MFGAVPDIPSQLSGSVLDVHSMQRVVEPVSDCPEDTLANLTDDFTLAILVASLAPIIRTPRRELLSSQFIELSFARELVSVGMTPLGLQHNHTSKRAPRADGIVSLSWLLIP